MNWVRRIEAYEGAQGSGSAPAILRPTRSDAGATIADADGGGAIAPVGDVWPGLGVEDYVSEDDTVGVVRMRNGPGAPAVGSVTGLPATRRRAGFDQISGSAYATVNLPDLGFTALIRFTTGSTLSTGAFSFAVAGNTGKDAWNLVLRGRRVQLDFRNSGGSPLGNVLTGIGVDSEAFPDGEFFMSAQHNRATGASRAALWNADGTLRAEATGIIDSSAWSWDGPYNLGFYHANPSLHFGNDAKVLTEGYGWAMGPLDDATLAAVIAARAAGTLTVDQIITTYAADLATDGAVSGIVDPTDATLLAYQSAGTPGQITAEPAP